MTAPVMKPSEALRKARELISDPKKWTKGAAARDSFGQETSALSTKATCFCSYGAIWRAMGRNDGDGLLVVENTLRKVLPRTFGGYNQYIDFWNDEETRTHAEVLAAFEKAIALAEEAGQ